MNKKNVIFLDFRQCDLSTEFQCDFQRCLPLTQKCNGYFNCDDRTDELDCSKYLIYFCIYIYIHLDSTACNTNQFRCVSDGRCIQNYQRCDFHSQCADGSDEANCSKKKRKFVFLGKT